MNLLCWHLIFVVGFLAEGHFVAHALRKFFFFLCGFSAERSTPFCDIFWRGIREYDKFTTISNTVDTRGVCWPLG